MFSQLSQQSPSAWHFPLPQVLRRAMHWASPIPRGRCTCTEVPPNSLCSEPVNRTCGYGRTSGSTVVPGLLGDAALRLRASAGEQAPCFPGAPCPALGSVQSQGNQAHRPFRVSMFWARLKTGNSLIRTKFKKKIKDLFKMSKTKTKTRNSSLPVVELGKNCK